MQSALLVLLFLVTMNRIARRRPANCCLRLLDEVGVVKSFKMHV